MATTLTPRGKLPLGASIVLEYGDYATDGSTAITISFSGGYIIDTEFSDANGNTLTAGTTPAVALTAKSLSGNVTSFTLTPSGGAVTGGTYMCVHGGT